MDPGTRRPHGDEPASLDRLRGHLQSILLTVPVRVSSAQFAAGSDTTLGLVLQRAWMGYQQGLDHQLALSRFDDRPLPDGRLLRLCDRQRAA
jgi:hypothetical protein